MVMQRANFVILFFHLNRDVGKLKVNFRCVERIHMCSSQLYLPSCANNINFLLFPKRIVEIFSFLYEERQSTNMCRLKFILLKFVKIFTVYEDRSCKLVSHSIAFAKPCKCHTTQAFTVQQLLQWLLIIPSDYFHFKKFQFEYGLGQTYLDRLSVVSSTRMQNIVLLFLYLS